MRFSLAIVASAVMAQAVYATEHASVSAHAGHLHAVSASASASADFVQDAVPSSSLTYESVGSLDFEKRGIVDFFKKLVFADEEEPTEDILEDAVESNSYDVYDMAAASESVSYHVYDMAAIGESASESEIYASILEAAAIEFDAKSEVYGDLLQSDAVESASASAAPLYKRDSNLQQALASIAEAQSSAASSIAAFYAAPSNAPKRKNRAAMKVELNSLSRAAVSASASASAVAKKWKRGDVDLTSYYSSASHSAAPSSFEAAAFASVSADSSSINKRAYAHAPWNERIALASSDAEPSSSFNDIASPSSAPALRHAHHHKRNDNHHKHHHNRYDGHSKSVSWSSEDWSSENWDGKHWHMAQASASVSEVAAAAVESISAAAVEESISAAAVEESISAAAVEESISAAAYNRNWKREVDESESVDVESESASAAPSLFVYRMAAASSSDVAPAAATVTVGGVLTVTKVAIASETVDDIKAAGEVVTVTEIATISASAADFAEAAEASATYEAARRDLEDSNIGADEDPDVEENAFWIDDAKAEDSFKGYDWKASE